MPATDQTHRFIFEHTDIRGEVVTLKDSYHKVLNHNPLPEPVQHLLGQFLAAASLLSSTLKFDGILTLQARGDGPVSVVMAECTHHKELRGIARLATDAADLTDVETANITSLLGKGTLVITITPAQGKPYQGIVPLDCDCLGDCLAYYFQQSEQLDTRFWLAADQNRASGILLQVLPHQTQMTAQNNHTHWETACHLADTVTAAELLDLPHQDLLFRLFNEEQIRLFSPTPVRFACSCSKQRSANALKALGEQEAHRLIAEQKAIVINCQFCQQQYQFNTTDVSALFNDQPHTLH